MMEGLLYLHDCMKCLILEFSSLAYFINLCHLQNDQFNKGYKSYEHTN